MDRDGDGKKDIKAFEDKELNIFGAKLKTGKFLTSVLKFVIIFFIIFLFTKAISHFFNLDPNTLPTVVSATAIPANAVVQAPREFY